MAVLVKLMGGLGNQMFQYACARALSIRHNTNILLDLEYLKDKSPKGNFTYRDYELKVFNIKADIASQTQLKRLNAYPKSRWNFYRLRLESWLGISKKYIESSIAFEPGIFQTRSKNIYLIGFWQSEKYFKNIEGIIREDFDFLKPLDNYNKAIADQILKTDSVSLHVRRGDYIKSASHVLCDKSYYEESIKFISSKVKEPHFYIFTEDMEWARTEFSFINNVTYITGNTGDRSFEDMRLMSFCKHNIIANSSFSWWGAWLNKNPDKIVIAPKRWLADSTTLSNDIVPQNWLKL